MKYYLIAGEASGDLHAANLMRALRKQDPEAEFRCVGGEKMKAAGDGELVLSYKKMAFMGFWEVITHLPTILHSMRVCKEDIKQWRPDVLILVDYPGFNLRIARFAKKLGLPVFYYISPQVWAWKANRVKHIRKNVDHMFVILPFEKSFYAKMGYEVNFVGHPLLDVLERLPASPDFRKKHGLDNRPIIALLPGSREQEIRQKLPFMSLMARHFEDHQFVVGALSELDEHIYQKYSRDQNLKLVMDDTYGLLHHAKAAAVTSGTATLETALFEVPQVVCYKGGKLSYFIGSKLVTVDYISLVNIILQREAVKELIQDQLNEKNLRRELTRLLDDGHRQQMLDDYRVLKQKLGGPGASERTARLMVNYLKEE